LNVTLGNPPLDVSEVRAKEERDKREQAAKELVEWGQIRTVQDCSNKRSMVGER